jgi:cupin 2 domain-containing protein
VPLVASTWFLSLPFGYRPRPGEWVIVLKGAARVEVMDSTVEISPGDNLDIPPRKKHHVAWTMPGEPTIWLAVHFSGK